MTSYFATKQIPPEKLQDFQIKMVGDEKCAEQLIIINGLKFGVGAGDENKGLGIGKIELVLEPREKPKVFVRYNKRMITQEVADCLGLEKQYRD